MGIFKIFTLLFVCFSLFVGNVASASMFCCQKPVSTDQIMKNRDMECHKSPDSDKTDHIKQCDDCKSCISSNVLNIHQVYGFIDVAAIKHMIFSNLFISVLLNDIDNPPKLIS